MKKLFFGALVACAAATFVGCGNSTPKADLKTDVDTMSYAMGMSQTQGLKEFMVERMGVDTAYMDDFIKGLNDGANAGDDKKKAAYYAGIQIGQQISNQMVKGINHEVFGEDLSNLGNMFFIEPLQYLEFVYLMEKATIVLTDSGGIQEEAPGLGKPVLVMRDTTERPEALASGTVHLVGTDYQKIMDEVSTLLEDEQAYEKMSKAVNPYGDGKACERIVEIFSKK